MSQMPFDDLEAAYETLAFAIDTAGEQRETLFLTRLALVLAHELGDIAAFKRAVQTALDELPERPAPAPASCDHDNLSWQATLHFLHRII